MSGTRRTASYGAGRWLCHVSRWLRQHGPRLLLAFVFAALAGGGFAQEDDPLRAVADRNEEISNRIAEATIAIEEPKKALADLRRTQTDLEQRMRWVERRASVQALGEEFAQTLREYLRGLPTSEQLAAGKARRMELLAAASAPTKSRLSGAPSNVPAAAHMSSGRGSASRQVTARAARACPIR